MKRHALFVGVNTYADPTIQNLAYPAEDATELASVFRRLLKFDRVEKLANPAHASDVVDAVKDMTKGLGPGDLFLFFFAGHGFRVKDNHVLVCAKDEFADLEDEDAGLCVGRLKKRMRGPWDRMLVLDACQNDIRATRGADCGVTSRDLELIHTSNDGTPGSGLQIVVTACSEGQKALEVADLGHGLFTSAFLDSVTAFADARRRIDLEALRTDLGGRMGRLIAQYRLSGKQEPMFTMPADAGGIVLLDGIAPMPSAPQPSPSYHQPGAAPAFVVCPVCGKYNQITDTFKCNVCGTDHLCMKHFSEERSCCDACAKGIEEKVMQEYFEKGEDYYHGRNGIEKNYEEAAKWYRKAAEQGHAQAQCCLGAMYADGNGVAKDDVEAVKWYRKAADQGDAEAQRFLGWMFGTGRGVPQDDVEAEKWYRTAAERGDAVAMNNLGWMYDNGRGVPQDDVEAVRWYFEAAKQGYELALNNLTFMFQHKRGVGKYDEEVVRWCRVAAEHGDAAAQRILGVMYADGIAVDKNDDEALRCFRRAAQNNDSVAQRILGWIYHNGCGVPQDIVEAVRWYLEAAKQGDEVAQNNLTFVFQDKRGVGKYDEDVVRWCRTAAEQGNAIAQYLMGLMYSNGRGVERDDVEAVRWYHRAAELGNENAQKALNELKTKGLV